MRLLLDTHIAIWAILDHPRLPAKARHLIADPTNEITVSVVSLWEIAAKNAALANTSNRFPVSARAAQDDFQLSGYALLQISAAHVHALESLPPIHKDPFDRMLVAQASETPLRLLTHDRRLHLYGDYVMCV